MLIECLAQDGEGRPFKTKKALKEALLQDPKSVRLIQNFGPRVVIDRWTGETLPSYVTASVTSDREAGRRLWSALIRRSSRGTLKVT